MRLFDSLQNRTAELTESLDQQRASGEVLAAISSSISDTKPVFDVILASCQRLFSGDTVGITLIRDDGLLDVSANAGPGSRATEADFSAADRLGAAASGTAILERRVIAFADIDASDVPARSREGARSARHCSRWLSRRCCSKGAASARFGSAGGSKERSATSNWRCSRRFADQAVIAIQNARLFNETREALDQQRASGEVLSAISSSIADTKPVFDVILASCERLFAGHDVGLMRLRDDGMLERRRL